MSQSARATPRFDITVHTDRGWWIIDIPDHGLRVRASVLADVVPVSLRALESALGHPLPSSALEIHIVRFSGGALIRRRWRIGR